MKRWTLLALFAVFAASTTSAQTETNPIRYTWIATAFSSWPDAMSRVMLDGGQKHAVALPTAEPQTPWIVLNRVEEGSIYVPPDEPYVCEVFESFTAAAALMSSVDACRAALIVTVPDGRTVVTMLRSCPDPPRRRAAR